MHFESINVINNSGRDAVRNWNVAVVSFLDIVYHFYLLSFLEKDSLNFKLLLFFFSMNVCDIGQ